MSLATRIRKALSDLTRRATPARSAKLRAIALEACGCEICLWVLNPPMTFAEHYKRLDRMYRMNEAQEFPTHALWSDLSRTYSQPESENNNAA